MGPKQALIGVELEKSLVFASFSEALFEGLTKLAKLLGTESGESCFCLFERELALFSESVLDGAIDVGASSAQGGEECSGRFGLWAGGAWEGSRVF